MTRFETIGKSKQFYDFLKNEILSGEYKAGDKFPSMRELAEKYKISKITVNSVISRLVTEGLLYVEQGRGTFVSERKPVHRNGKVMIGVMLFDFRTESSVEAGIFYSIQENLKDDYFVVPYNSYDNVGLFYKGLKGFAELNVDGLILVPPTSEKCDPAVVKSLIASDLPVVLINRRIPSINADFMTIDLEEGVYKAIKYILGKNKRRIALIKHNSATLGNQMYEGYKRAHLEAELPVIDGLVAEWLPDRERAEAFMNSKINEIDGLVGSDYVIYKTRKIIYSSRKRIPEDISIVGINDSVYSRFMSPPLTAIPFPSEKIGKAAIEAVIERIENKRDHLVEKSFVPDIVVRSS